MAQYDIDLREYWRVIRRRKVIVILTTVLLAFFSIALAIIRAPSPLYEATCSVKFEKSVSPLGLYTMIISIGPGDVMQTQMGVIKSHSVFKKVALNMGLIDKTEDSDPSVGRIISDLQSKVQVSRQGNSNIIDIRTTANSPAFAADLANQVALAYKETHAHEINRRIAQAIKFIKEQLGILDGRLRESEEKLRRFREDKNLIVLSSQSSNLLSRVDSLETRLFSTMEARRELKDVMERINEASSKPLDLKGSFSSEKASALYIKLNSRLIDLMLERDTLLVQYTSSHPQIIEIDNQIIEITRKMLTELKSHLKIQEEKEKWLREEIDIVKEKIQSLPTEGLELSRLESDVDRTDKIYSLLETKHQEALIQDAEKPEEVGIVRPALEPSRPINSPKIFSSGLLGAMIGLVLGLVFAFIVETFDTSLGAIDEVEESLGLQVLGLIPHIEPKEIQATLKDNKGILHDPVARNACLIPRFGSQSVLAESFRSLRTSIQFGALEKNIKSIVLTSTTPQEGKSIVAANLAIVMAQGGLKTLILGADLRKPTIYRIFGLDASPGLTDLLLGNYDFSETVRTVTDIMMGKMSMDEIMLTPGIDNLHIMTGGTIPSNPAELMHSEKFKGLVDEIHDKYDVILIDTPPLISAADASILAMLSDGVLLVYRAGMVARGVLKRVKTQLEQVKANIIGVVLNGVKADISPDYED
ncbi:MAG: polysaccharide biosynthesis tyrosine autokinase, partial [Desulfatiglandales bacterium]